MAAKKPTRRKTTAKSADIPKIPQPHGGALNAGGTPGNKGGTGRPPKAFKDFLSEMRQDVRVQQQLEEALTDNTHVAFKAALDVLVKYDDEKPAEKREHTMTQLTPEQRQSRVLDLLKAAKQRKGA